MNPQSRQHTLRHPLYLVTAALTIGVSFYAYHHWDRPTLDFIFAQTDPRIEQWSEGISLLGTIIRPEIAFLVWLIYRKRNPRWATAALFFLVAIAGAGLTNTLLKIFFGRSRPEMFFEEGLKGFYWFEIDAAFWSMPSGHTAATMAAMMTATLLFPRLGGLLLLQAGLVAASRVALMEHYVSDVLIGGVVGSGVALALFDLYFRDALERVNWWRGGRRGFFNPRSGRDSGPIPDSD